MKIEDMIEFLQSVKELHGNVDLRAVEPQYRTTPGLHVVGGFVDSDGAVLVLDPDGDYFSTDQDDAYESAQFGEFFPEMI